MNTLNLFGSLDSIASHLTTCGYLDPGTGSYALQLILAGVFGGLFACKQSWRQLRAWMIRVGPSGREAS